MLKRSKHCSSYLNGYLIDLRPQWQLVGERKIELLGCLLELLCGWLISSESIGHLSKVTRKKTQQDSIEKNWFGPHAISATAKSPYELGRASGPVALVLYLA